MQGTSITEQNERKLLRRLEENDRLFLRRFCSLLDGTFRRIRSVLSEEQLTEKVMAIKRAEERKLSKCLADEVTAVFAIGEAHATLLCREKFKRFEKNRLAVFIPWFIQKRKNLTELMNVDPKDFWLRPKEAIDAFKLRENLLAKDVNGTLWKDVRQIMAEHLDGTPRKDTLAKLDKLQDVTERRAELIVTTESTYAYNRGRLAGFKKAEVDYVRFSAVLDMRTSAQCKSRHGKVMRIDSADLADNTPPLHGRCRSILSPIYSKYEPGEITAENTDWSKVTPLPKNWRTGGTKTPDVMKPACLRMENAADHRAAAEIVKADMAMLPKKHQEILAKHGVRVTFGHEFAYFNRKSGELAIAAKTIPGELIHEAGHALETYLGLYRDPNFVKVLRNGIPFDKIRGLAGSFNVETMYGRYAVYLAHPDVKKFVSVYQSYSFDFDILGRERFLELNGRDEFNELTLIEYFSEGYRAFFLEPELLKAKDILLYKFIEEMSR